MATATQPTANNMTTFKTTQLIRATYWGLLALALLAPFLGLYPVFVMKLLCFAIFACAFNLLLGCLLYTSPSPRD